MLIGFRPRNICIIIPYMNPRISWNLATVHSDGGIAIYAYVATYFDEQDQVIVHGEGSTVGQALADLYRHLDQLGYDRSELPKPGPELAEDG